jgi:hypothetical protein
VSHNHWLFRITSKPDESASSDVLILRKTIAYEQSLTASLLGLLASAAFGSAVPSQLHQKSAYRDYDLRSMRAKFVYDQPEGVSQASRAGYVGPKNTISMRSVWSLYT